jgi:ABC-type bacteriocin/lantibiotic exporter with double-glycine peptidase domain
MKKCHTTVLLVCGIAFVSSYKLAAWHYYSGQPILAVECTTPYGGIVSGELMDFNQTGEETCGQAVLAFFLSGVGCPETEASIIEETGISSMLSLADMNQVFTSRGFKTQLLKVDPEYFKERPVTAILHWSSQHFVVFLQEENGEPVIFDPNYGRVFVSWKNLLGLLSGYMLYIYQ